MLLNTFIYEIKRKSDKLSNIRSYWSANCNNSIIQKTQPRIRMINNNKDKRLVLIGIRRKGEKGFRKSFDSNVESNQSSIIQDSVHIPQTPDSKSSQIINLLSE